MAVDFLAEKLVLLQTQGFIAESRLGARDRTCLKSLFEAGVLQTARSGAGRRVVLHDANALKSFMSKTYPSGPEGVTAKVSSRSQAIAELRDSKKARTTQPVAVLLRGFNGSTFHSGNQALAVADWSAMAGVAALRLDEKTLWGFSGTVAFVENLEVFWNFEKLDIKADIAIYAQGRLNSKVLAWLASPAMQHARIIHCGDYDPVGLDEFLRLQSACPGRTELFIPPDLESLLSRYGKKELISDNIAILARLRKNADPQVRFVVELINRWGVGLEQEVLLLK
nr:hypothetical protein [Desulfobulbaceae bacterium]